MSVCIRTSLSEQAFPTLRVQIPLSEGRTYSPHHQDKMTKSGDRTTGFMHGILNLVLFIDPPAATIKAFSTSCNAHPQRRLLLLRSYRGMPSSSRLRPPHARWSPPRSARSMSGIRSRRALRSRTPRLCSCSRSQMPRGASSEETRAARSMASACSTSRASSRAQFVGVRSPVRVTYLSPPMSTLGLTRMTDEIP